MGCLFVTEGTDPTTFVTRHSGSIQRGGAPSRAMTASERSTMRSGTRTVQTADSTVNEGVALHGAYTMCAHHVLPRACIVHGAGVCVLCVT